MINYREILRLISLGYTQGQIASSLHCFRNTVRDVKNTSARLEVKWPLDDSVSNEDLEALLYPKKNTPNISHKEPDYEYVHNIPLTIAKVKL